MQRKVPVTCYTRFLKVQNYYNATQAVGRNYSKYTNSELKRQNATLKRMVENKI